MLETGSHGEKRNCGQRDDEGLGSSEVRSEFLLEVQADDRGSDLTQEGEMCLFRALALWSLCLLSWNLKKQESQQIFPLAGWSHHSALAAAFPPSGGDSPRPLASLWAGRAGVRSGGFASAVCGSFDCLPRGSILGPSWAPPCFSSNRGLTFLYTKVRDWRKILSRGG